MYFKKYQHIFLILFINSLLLYSAIPAFSLTNDSSSPTDTILNLKQRNSRIFTTALIQGAVLGASFYGMNQAWYKDYPKSKFHVWNDYPCWLQMDKLGHAWTTYQYSRTLTQIWKDVKLDNTASIMAGTGTAMAAQTTMEIMDGFSAGWGFSWGDIAANSIGALAFAGQEALWGEQRVSIKMGYLPEHYAEGSLKDHSEILFGKSFEQRILKDYNSQTYWASFNLKSFAKRSGLPSWLNLAIGYGASGMYGARYNKWTDKNGTLHNRGDISRLRHFYFSPDIDLSRIPTKNKILKKVFFLADIIKIPAPTLEYVNNGKWNFKPLWL